MSSKLIKVVETLEDHFDYNELQTYPRFDHPDPEKRMDYWQVLFQIIISQRATLEKEVKGANKFFNEFSTLQDVANSNIEEIGECIHLTGLHRQKAKAIKSIAKTILEDFNGNLQELLELESKEIREKLLELPQVGSKTADCMLELGFGLPFLPVDVNVRRVSTRLELVPGDVESYEGIRISLENQLPKDVEIYRKVHTYLLGLGKFVCKANSHCDECPVACLCNYERENANA